MREDTDAVAIKLLLLLEKYLLPPIIAGSSQMSSPMEFEIKF
jgi:hypothetical protein